MRGGKSRLCETAATADDLALLHPTAGVCRRCVPGAEERRVIPQRHSTGLSRRQRQRRGDHHRPGGAHRGGQLYLHRHVSGLCHQSTMRFALDSGHLSELLDMGVYSE